VGLSPFAAVLKEVGPPTNGCCPSVRQPGQLRGWPRDSGRRLRARRFSLWSMGVNQSVEGHVATVAGPDQPAFCSPVNDRPARGGTLLSSPPTQCMGGREAGVWPHLLPAYRNVNDPAA